MRGKNEHKERNEKLELKKLIIDLFLIGPSNCTDLVANQPEAFKNAFWEFGSFQVYQAS